MGNSKETLKGAYSEHLKTGGELKVSAYSWHLEYYFSGPDLRYNGTFVRVESKQIDAYIEAWKNNFSKYLQLKEILPKGGSSDYHGEMGMSIRIGGFNEGVCLQSYHLPIKTQAELSEIIDDYEGAKKKAALIQRILRREDTL